MIYIKNINELAFNLELKLLDHFPNSFIYGKSHNNLSQFKLFLHEDIDLNTHESDFFNIWFQKSFDFLKTKYLGATMTDEVITIVENEVNSTFKYLIQNGKLKESFLKFYFEKGVVFE